MQIIVRTIEGSITNYVTVENQSRIWMERCTDGALRLFVYDENDTEYEIGWFTPDSWRSAVVVDANAAVWAPEDLTNEADQGDAYPDDKHPF